MGETLGEMAENAKLTFIRNSNGYLGFTEESDQSYKIAVFAPEPPSTNPPVQPYDLLQHEYFSPSSGVVLSIALESKKFCGVYLCCEQRKVCAIKHPNSEQSKWMKWGFKEIYPNYPYPRGNREAILLQFYGDGYEVDPRTEEGKKNALFLICDGKVRVASYMFGSLYGALVLQS